MTSICSSTRASVTFPLPSSAEMTCTTTGTVYGGAICRSREGPNASRRRSSYSAACSGVTSTSPSAPTPGSATRIAAADPETGSVPGGQWAACATAPVLSGSAPTEDTVGSGGVPTTRPVNASAHRDRPDQSAAEPPRELRPITSRTVVTTERSEVEPNAALRSICPIRPISDYFCPTAQARSLAILSRICGGLACATGGPPQARRSSLWITPCGLPVR